MFPHYRTAPAKPALETDLKTLADAANEAAKREAAQWFFFVTIMLTVAAIVGSTTHRVMLLESPVRVPVLSIELPLVGFYWAAPAVFVVLHFYLMAQVRLMAEKVAAFLDKAAAETEGRPAALRMELKRLDPFPVAQMLAAERLGDRALPTRLMVWVTLGIAPLLILLFVQIRFLPYQDVTVTWWHRIMLLLDLGLLWWLWPRSRRRRKLLRITACFAGSFAVLWISAFIITIPDEEMDRYGEAASASLVPWLLRFFLFGGSIPYAGSVPGAFARTLVLTDEVLIPPEDLKSFRESPEKALANIARTTVLRGRNLRRARLDRVDLRRADLSGARLGGANLSGAKLSGANFDFADLQGANLWGAQLNASSLAVANLRYAEMSKTDLRGAHLRSADLRDAKLQAARMSGADLDHAKLQGAVMGGVRMDGVSLRLTELQGADLTSAELRGASLRDTKLQGAWLVRAQLQGATFIDAQMQGAWLVGADLRGASLVGVRMQGSHLIRAQMQGAFLQDVALWRATALGADMRAATLERSDFDRQPPCRTERTNCIRWPSWRDWIASLRSEMPIGLRGETRFAAVTSPFDRQREAEMRRLFEPVSGTAGATEAILVDLACDGRNGPFVARGILRQIQSTLDDGGRTAVDGAAVAGRLLREECAGARGLTEDERARLVELASGGR